MDPSAAIPLHFTIETTTLAAAGLVLAWAALSRRLTASVGAAALVIAQGIHAGEFVEGEGHPLVVVLRMGSIAVLAATVLRSSPDRRLFGTGLSALTVGSVWGAIAGGTSAEMSIGGHLFIFAGAVLWFVWAWRSARPSIRLRVLTAFVAVLTVTVVVAGGAVSRVGAVNSREALEERLVRHSATLQQVLVESRDEMVRRAAALSPALAPALPDGSPSIEEARLPRRAWAVVIGPDRIVRSSFEAQGAHLPYPPGEFSGREVTEDAFGAEVASAVEVAGGGVLVVAAAPVFRPGGQRIPEDVVGVVAVGRVHHVDELRDLAADPVAHMAAVDPAQTASSDADLVLGPGDLPDETTMAVTSNGQDWLVAVAPLPDGDAVLVVAASQDHVAVAATDLLRAFLLGIFAAALLAVVAALWLSARLARPMLDLADEAERVKSDFLASVSHELRTPLTPIRGYTEILRKQRVPARAASGYLDEIGDAAQRLERIVTLLVDVASLEAGRFVLDIDPLEVTELLHDAADRWRDAGGGRLRVRAAKSLPKVQGDAGALGRVLDELLDNAFKFAPTGTIELRAGRRGSAVQIAVSDRGPGIEAERVAALMQAFEQAEPGDTRRFGGLGLGLTFAAGVLGVHGTTLSIASESGEGTTASFVLPATGRTGRVSRMPAQAVPRRQR